MNHYSDQLNFEAYSAAMSLSRGRIDASADDPIEVRRGRPRTRLEHPSDLLDRVRTGGEIRSYNRKKSMEPKLSCNEEDPKQSLLKALTKIVAEDPEDALSRVRHSRFLPHDRTEGPKEEEEAHFERATIDSSISDSEKLELLHSNTLVNRKLYAGGRPTGTNGVGPASTSSVSAEDAFDSAKSLPAPPMLKRRPDMIADQSSFVDDSQAHPPPPPVVIGDGVYLPSELPKRYGKRTTKILLNRPMAINIDPEMDVDDNFGKSLTANSTPTIAVSSITPSTSIVEPSPEETVMKRFRPIAPAPDSGVSSDAARGICAAESSVAESIKCFFCRFEAYDRMEFFLHMKEEHVVNPAMKCNVCQMEFTEEELLMKHYVKEHYSCKLCGYTEMSSIQGVDTHLRFHHNVEYRRHGCGGQLEPVDLPIPANFGSPDVEVNNLQCGQCGLLTTYQQFYNLETLRKSRKSRTFRHECEHCPYETRDIEAFKRHQQHHDKSLWKLEKCSLCDFVTHEDHLMKSHRQQHLKGTALKCETCRFYTIGENRMALHRTVHTGKKILKCSYCNFVTINPRILSHHLKNHSIRSTDFETKKDLIVKCGQCDFRGPWLEVDAHVRTHAKMENHKCVLCEREFATKTGYKKHLQQHTGEYPFPCPQCEKGYFDEYSLRDHIFAHQGIKPYKCVCGQRYQRKKNLVVHEKMCMKNQEQLLRNYGQQPTSTTTSSYSATPSSSRPRITAPGERENTPTIDTWMQAGGMVDRMEEDE